VQIDSNFAFMDESERVSHGVFATADQAKAACRIIVDDFLASALKPGMSSAGLWEAYTLFGDDPFVMPVDPNTAPAAAFDAWGYARRRCEEIAGVSASHWRVRARLRPVTWRSVWPI
jgi:hypothetical protein